MRTINVHPPQRRLRCSRVLFFIIGVLLCFFYSLMLRARLSELSTQTNVEEKEGDDVLQVKVREAIARNVTQEEVTLPASTPSTPVVIIVNRTDIEQCIYVEPQPPPTTITPTPRPPPQPPHRKGEYPEDIFSVEQRRQGWVVLHASGMIYMFVALAIVCDEFFVPALEVITNKLDISDDVAGATFMASGGSAPELFTSLIGVFVSHSNVGIGTIIGSAVFNILFVIGMCAIFSREVLHLTWWPLFRDVSFYTLDLIMLIVFFLDNMILWWESAMLVLGYVSYVCFMKFNSHIEQVVKTQLNKHMSIVQAWSTQDPKERDPTTSPPPRPAAFAEKNKEDKSKHQSELLQSPLPSSKPPDLQEDKDKLRVRPVLQRGGSAASLHNTLLRSTIFQLMIHTLDPLGEDSTVSGAFKPPTTTKARGETSTNSNVRGEGLMQKKAKNRVKPQNVPDTEKSHQFHMEDEDRKPKCELSPAGASNIAAVKQSTTQPSAEEIKSMDNNRNGSQGSSGGSSDDGSGDGDSSNSGESEDDNGEDEGEEENAPLSLDWPESRRKQATYLVLLPIVFPLWLTLPDVRNPMSKKYFTFTFIGSILWIAVFSYLMVWWAHQVGETMGISEEIMGLTILAAGTSIPDLITSVIVARKGLGDMAVSSSVGSNIFDITVGLPVPWLLYSLLHDGAPVAVSSNGLFCAIVLLFLMLLFVTISIATCRWKMSRTLGLAMFALYFVFLILSVLLEDRVLVCSISI
ncbi:sodium/potassium/calcium exchanger 1-like isoform X1 [Nerophis ophidion]|uniref:sodium/potassium/calcium exchanger 1-like isoform X1 n=1 Tax=Nerophis ophidion TaxID=159077 RepID=UPI002ADFC2A6|nr:sodium/potassium/calcium exchanger 1-like isoform X1 [Nerophis ophidion]